MKRYLLLWTTAFIVNSVDAQTGMWTWMKGSNYANPPAYYGTQGVAAPSNTPAGRGWSHFWQDTSDNLYVYSGWGYDAGGTLAAFNDIWKYSIASNEWSWLQGDTINGKPPVYGMQGVSAPSNYPGSQVGNVSWQDLSGNWWVLGYNTDLWKYDVSSHEWTWMKGDTIPNYIGVYGTKGQSSPANLPAVRERSVSWTDLSGNLWLFGGMGLGRFFNDLWKYSIATNEWTWVSGDSIPWVRGTYNVQGVPSASGKPCARHSGNGWIDASGDLWLFGGLGCTAVSVVGYYNDLWRYNISTNMWTWIRGDSVMGASGVFGIQGQSSTATQPGGRWQGSAAADKQGNFWLFGGAGFGSGTSEGLLNDLWKYSPSTNDWTWVAGDEYIFPPAVYGTQGVTSTNNKPGGKTGSRMWFDKNGNLWLFGAGDWYAGGNFSSYNDLWKYTPASAVPLHLLTFTAHLSEQLAAGSGQNAIVNLRWTSENEINFDRYEIERSINGREFSKAGTVRAANSREYSYDDNIGGLSSVVGGRFYYRLKMIDKDGSFTYSKVEQVSFKSQHSVFNITPNPATTSIQLQFSNLTNGKVDVQVSDVAGKVLYRRTSSVINGLLSIPTINLASSTYVVRVIADGEVSSEKVVVR